MKETLATCTHEVKQGFSNQRPLVSPPLIRSRGRQRILDRICTRLLCSRVPHRAPAIARLITAAYLAAARARSLPAKGRLVEPSSNTSHDSDTARQAEKHEGCIGPNQHPVSAAMPLAYPAEALADRLTSTSNLVSITEQTPRSPLCAPSNAVCSDED